MISKVSIVFYLLIHQTVGSDDNGAAVARNALEQYLAKIPGAQAGGIEPVTDKIDSVTGTGHFAFSVRFRGYPLRPPKPFGNTNLFIVDHVGNVERVRNDKELKRFFTKSLKSATSDAEALAAFTSWLKLSTQLHQDGYYTFKLDEDSIRLRSEHGERIVSGKADVTEGGEGQIVATMRFDPSGRVTKTSTDRKLLPGERPAAGRLAN